MGMLFGTFVQTIALVIITYKTNWDEQVLTFAAYLLRNVEPLFICKHYINVHLCR